MSKSSFISAFKVASTPLCVIFLILAAELVFRAVFLCPEAVYQPWRYLPKSPAELGLSTPDDDPSVRYRLTPSWSGIFRGAPFNVNQLGFRGPEVGEKSPHCLRVGVPGNSITQGSGLDDHSHYPAVLGELLNDEGGQNWEVFNLGVGGYSYSQMTAAYFRYEELLDLDVVVFPVFVSDLVGARLMPPPSPLWETPPFYKDIKGFLRRHLFIVRLGDSNRWLKANLAQDWAKRGRDKSRKTSGLSFPFLHDHLAAWSRERRGKNVQVVVVALPQLDEVQVSTAAEEQFTAEWLASNPGMQFIDTRPHILGHTSQLEGIYPGDWHFNAASNRLIAEAIARQWDRIGLQSYPGKAD